jgi:hypothetical protein
MNSNVIKSISQMRSGVTSATSQMIATVANNLSTMVSVGQSLVSQFGSALRSGAQQGVNGFRSAIQQIPGIVSSVGGSAAGVARSIGANISQAFASGMSSALGAIRAAAAAMVAAAQSALLAKAMISSPSKLFMWDGEMIGVAPALGIRKRIPDVVRSVRDLVGAARGAMERFGVDSPAMAFATPASARYLQYGNGVPASPTYNDNRRLDVGGVTIVQRPGEDADALYRRFVGLLEADQADVAGTGR